MNRITLKTLSKTYDIIVGNNILNNAADLYKTASKKVFIMTDSNVAPLYLKTVLSGFKENDCLVSSCTIKAGEKSKNLSVVEKIYNLLCENKITKSDLIVALGGGVVGDISGFVASTYLRGVPHIQIPTTLLAEVDSSIGGKCGVNLKHGKNLAGSIYQPECVICDLDVLETLPTSEFNNGMAEAIKCGFIYNKDILKSIESNDLENVILGSINVKREIVEIDEQEKNLRMLLNFGHTFGHAIERLGDYKLFSHGQAISMGMVLAVKYGIELNITPKACLEKLKALLSKFNLPVECPYNLKQMLTFLMSDKKIRNEKINFIFLTETGKAEIFPIDKEQITNYKLG